MLPALADLDSDWVTQHFSSIFPQDETERLRRHAAWTAYCIFRHPYVPLLSLLDREYRHAINALEEQDEYWSSTSIGMHLTEHIVQLYY